MLENDSFWSMLVKGGWTMLPLFLCSVLSLGVIAERLWVFFKSKVDTPGLMEKLGGLLRKKDIAGAVSLCDQTGGPVGRTLKAGLVKKGKSAKEVEEAMLVKAREEVLDLEKHLAIVGTIGNIAPFIGLFGTVLGVIRAFNDIALTGSGGAAVVAKGIAEALIATAGGLFVAVPAVIGYNYLLNWVERYSTELQSCCEETLDLLESKEN